MGAGVRMNAERQRSLYRRPVISGKGPTGLRLRRSSLVIVEKARRAVRGPQGPRSSVGVVQRSTEYLLQACAILAAYGDVSVSSLAKDWRLGGAVGGISRSLIAQNGRGGVGGWTSASHVAPVSGRTRMCWGRSSSPRGP
jgi:hypothetical protein